MRSVHSQNGFTIIEIAIILTIIAIISAAILVGYDLIRAAEIRATIKQFERFNAATNAFQLKYDCLPGDCTNPRGFGFNLATAGNGDGIVGACPRGNPILGPSAAPSEPCSWVNNVGSSGSIDMEYYHFWYNLYEAGFIREHIDFTPGPAPNFSLLAGNGTPEGAIRPARRAPPPDDNPGGWALHYNVIFASSAADSAGGGEIFGHSFMLTNKLLIGGMPADNSFPGGYHPFVLFAIDQKTDDAKPFTGNTRAWQAYARWLDPLASGYPEFGTDRPTQFYIVKLLGKGPAGPDSPVCISTDGGEYNYNVLYEGVDFHALCSLALKAAF